MAFSSLRAKRVINSFINCVKLGSYSYSYAVLLIEDELRYGYLTEADKEVFYANCDGGVVDNEYSDGSESEEIQL